MSITPFVPPPTTRRARALAKELVKTVESFCEEEPHTRPREIDRAFQLARSRLGSERRTLVLAVIGLLVLIVGISMFLSQTR